MITTEVVVSNFINKQKIVRRSPQKTEIFIDLLKFDLSNISTIVEEAIELIEELSEDIADDNTPAIIKPLRPIGILYLIYSANILFELDGSKSIEINEPTNKNTQNCTKTKKPLPSMAFFALEIFFVERTRWTIK